MRRSRRETQSAVEALWKPIPPQPTMHQYWNSAAAQEPNERYGKIIAAMKGPTLTKTAVSRKTGKMNK